MLSSEIINCYLHGLSFRKIASRANAKALVSQKRTANTNRGCPCKGAGRTCGSECSCGSTAKPLPKQGE